MEIKFETPKVLKVIPETVLSSDTLNIVLMTDDPLRKIVTVTIDRPPHIINLWKDEEYDAIGNWTNEDVIARLNEILPNI